MPFVSKASNSLSRIDKGCSLSAKWKRMETNINLEKACIARRLHGNSVSA
jgi:hypothetical protein